ncbi:MAG TPA: hypothetical protein VGA61_07895 [Anaerolineae bacterium]
MNREPGRFMLARSVRNQSPSNAGDDGIRPLTLIVAWILAPFLVLAFLVLYFFPDNGVTLNGRPLWAWLVYPAMAPLIMGAGYLSGAYFFIRLILGGRWHWFTHGFPAITVFTWDMGLATVLHWAPFLHTGLVFYLWCILYAVTPFLVPYVWFRNLPADPQTPEPGEVLVPDAVRRLVRIISILVLALALFMFISPSSIIPIWPWKLVPLSTRTLAGWFTLPSVMGLFVSGDPRWSAWRTLMESQVIAFVLMLVGVVRAWSSFNPANPLTWLFVSSLVAMLAAILVLYASMARRPAFFAA